MTKAFTFSQLAIILMVVLGLTVAIVVAVTQLQGASGSISDIGDSVDDAITGGINLGLECIQTGGKCIAKTLCEITDTAYSTWTDAGELGCGTDSGLTCCVPPST